MTDNFEINSLAQAEACLQQLELFYQRQLLQVRAIKSMQQVQQPVVERDYRGWDRSEAMRDYLASVGEELSEEQIAEALKRFGCDPGENLLKNIRIAVSMTPSKFYRNGKNVGLVSWRKQRVA